MDENARKSSHHVFKITSIVLIIHLIIAQPTTASDAPEIFANSDNYTPFYNDTLKLLEEISLLSRYAAYNSVEQMKLTSLATRVQDFQKELAKQKDELEHQNTTTSLNDQFNSTLNTFRKEFANIKDQMTDKETEEQKKRSLELCLADLKYHRYGSADTRFFKMKDNSQANTIVNRFYNHYPDSFNTLIEFADYIGSIDRSFAIFKALHNEMKAHRHEAAMQQLQLGEHIRSQVINQGNVKPEVKQDAQVIFNETRAIMKKFAIQNLTNAFLKNNFSGVKNFTEKLSISCNECLNEILKDVMYNLRGKLTSKDLLNLVQESNAFSTIPTLTAIYAAIFNKITNNYDTNSSLLKLALLTKEIIEKDDCPDITQSTKNELKLMKALLPKPIKNIVYSSKIQLKNIFYNEFLNAATSHENWNDKDRRQVLLSSFNDTKCEDNDQGGYLWKLEHEGEEFKFINIKFNEQLYAGSSKWDEERRSIFTWKQLGAISGNRWSFEADMEYAYLKNTLYNEYLFGGAFGFLHDEFIRAAFTQTKGKKGESSSWEIVDCS